MIKNFKELGIFSKDLQVLKYNRVYSVKDLPLQEKKEIVFIGKSNVGKSTLINTILNYKINKTSKEPGCTKWIAYIELQNTIIIDLPGYGYSKVAKGRKEFWNKMVLEYINKKRTNLALILIDSRRGIQEIDHEVSTAFDNSQFIYTKCDKANFPENNIIKTSSSSGLGILELRNLLI